MRQREPVDAACSECRVAQAARRRFQPFARVARHAHAQHGQRHRQFFAQFCAELRPTLSVRTQPVMHMDCLQRKRQFGLGTQDTQRVQKNNGIKPTGKRHAQGRPSLDPRRQKRRQRRNDPLRSGCLAQ